MQRQFFRTPYHPQTCLHTDFGTLYGAFEQKGCNSTSDLSSTLSSTAATSSKLAAWVAVLERHHPIQKMIYVGNQPLTYLPIGSFLNRLSCRAKAGLDSVHSCVHLLVFSTGQCHEYYLQNCFYRCTPLLYLISHL